MFDKIIMGLKTAAVFVLTSVSTVISPQKESFTPLPSPSPVVVIASSSAILTPTPSPSPDPPRVTEPEAVAATKAAVIRKSNKEVQEIVDKMHEKIYQDKKEGKEPTYNLGDIIRTAQQEYAKRPVDQ